MKRQVMGLSSKMNFKKAYAQGTKQTFQKLHSLLTIVVQLIRGQIGVGDLKCHFLKMTSKVR